MSDEHAAPVSPFFRRWAMFILRFRFPLLAANLAATAFFVLQLPKATIDSSTEAFLSSDSDAVQVLDELRDSFGMDVFVEVVVEGDVFSEAFLQRLKALHEDLEDVDPEILPEDEYKGDEDEADEPAKARPGQSVALAEATGMDGFDDGGFEAFGDDGDFVDLEDSEGWGDEAGGSIMEDVTSLINVRHTYWKEGGLRVEGLLDGFPEKRPDLVALRELVLDDPSMVGRVVGPEGRHAVIVMQTRRLGETGLGKVYDAAMEVAGRHDAEGFRVQVAGMPALNATLNRTMVTDSRVLSLFAILVNLIALFVIFRHPYGVFGPLLVVVQAALWTFGMMAYTGTPITIVTNILPAFLIAVGLGDSVHMQSVYRDARRDGMPNESALIHAVSTTGMPVLFTTLTTAVGLMSFQFASLGAIQNFGLFGAFGVMVALLESMLFLPLVLSFNKKSTLGSKTPEEGSHDTFDRILGFCNGLSRPAADGSRRRMRLNIALTAAFAATMGAGAALVELRHNPLEWIPDHFAAKQAIKTIDEKVGGSAGLAAMIEAKPGETLKQRELMQQLAKLETHVHAYRDETYGKVVKNDTSVLDVIRESWRAVKGGAEEHYAVPSSQQGVVDMFTMFQTASPEHTRKLVTVDMKRALFSTRCTWMDALRFGPLAAHVQAGIDRYIGDLANVKLAGAIYNLLEVVQALLWDLLRSFGTAFAVITLIMIVLLRDLKLGVIAMVPNLLPIIGCLGVMGFTGMPLDGSTMLIASIAIGIAVDDTIHYLHQFKSHFDMHGDVEAAIDHAFNHSGRAMLATSLVLFGGFMVNLASSMYNMQRFGGLVSLTIVLALLIDLICTPAILRAVYGRTRAKAST